MSTLAIYQVDAFVDPTSDQPFTGNPAAVCPVDEPLSDALMQAIAAENNLSETAFFHRDGDAFNLRWFTPTVEVELCGHATLASAFVLMAELEPERTEAHFQTRSGRLTVRRRDDEFELDFPLYPPVPLDDAAVGAAIAEALGEMPTEILRARSYLAVFPDADAIRRLSPDMAALARLDTSVCVTAAGGPPGVDFVCRYFAPRHGVPEDPVTGSAFCMLAPYWIPRIGRDRLRARQLSRRGGEVVCHVQHHRTLIAGRAQLVLVGRFRHPALTTLRGTHVKPM
jgi:PhzF family phenazine biosynthesis protein